MQIIPVIDIKGGQVVHARGGNRQNYPPLESVLSQSTEPLQLIADLLDWYPFSRLYIADLDSIMSARMPELELFQSLSSAFPQLIFWLDVGLTSLEQREAFSDLTNIRLVLGTESLPCPDSGWSKADETILSLDFKQGHLLGSAAWLSRAELWPKDVIVMNLDAVGSASGVNLQMLDEVKKQRQDVRVYAAGGVRSTSDLYALKQAGVEGALIATALHQGHIIPGSLLQLENETPL
ncbi:histidine biosynthesis protein [Methylophaga lonarensis MPL]|uniref:Histidine biosynthesis protein n=1 Tax=Methylophaga lonarensis MPL TaxID=1286106 RepID=M7P345_9GAMM|nr:HisA/HisF-related TIM barrel protein [Methylophaga lonarensis]EMR13927.1 histidine biosynthesis protein [Methylophaga lonarensis MPL]